MTGRWEKIGFLDDREDLREVLGFPVLGKLNSFQRFLGQYPEAFVAIGNNRLRLKWIRVLQESGFQIPVLIHPHSSVSRHSTIADGTVVMAGAVVNACTTIERGCIVNTCSSIDHDCYVEEGVHVSPGSHVGGTVHIGRCTWLCIHSSVANNLKIGRFSTVAAGAVVIRNIPDNVMVAGVPATIKKQLGDDWHE
jgi:sugar O-acyltransferase (sialic acid O-acetyltransferase NeuD family)